MTAYNFFQGIGEAIFATGKVPSDYSARRPRVAGLSLAVVASPAILGNNWRSPSRIPLWHPCRLLFRAFAKIGTMNLAFHQASRQARVPDVVDLATHFLSTSSFYEWSGQNRSWAL